MGYPMARNLARAGHQVAVWSNTASKASSLLPRESDRLRLRRKQVAEQADFIFACVGDTRMSEEVFTGPNGVIEGAKPGTVVADASTISPTASRGIGEETRGQGHPFSGRALHRIHAGRHQRHANLHDRRRSGGL